MTADERTPLYFRLFNEIGIINQLATALLQSRLPEGLLAPHFSVLNHLVRVSDGRTPLEMAKAFQVPKTTMTHQVGVLERRGLVVQAPNPDDGRSKRVWLTDDGRALRESVVHGFADMIDRWSEVISIEETAELVPRLERLRKYLDETRAATARPPGD